jgi:ComF family protein
MNRSFFNTVYSGIIGIFWPYSCALCGERTTGEPVCPDCVEAMKLDCGKYCPECERSLSKKEGRCPEHPIAPYPFYIPIFAFDDRVRDLVHLLKYSGRKDVGRFFGKILSERLSKEGYEFKSNALVPVPLASVRKRERGFNQSEVVAKTLAKKNEIPVATGFVKRIKITTSQTKLNAHERRINVSGAFEANRKIEGKKVIIIDDVITTGATTRELANAIIIGGGSVECAICIAKPGFSDSKNSNI